MNITATLKVLKEVRDQIQEKYSAMLELRGQVEELERREQEILEDLTT